MESEKRKETQVCMPGDLRKHLYPITCFLRYSQEVQMFHRVERWVNRLRHLDKKELQKFCNNDIRHLSKFKISKAGRKHKAAQRYLFPCLIKILALKMNLKMRLITMTNQEREIRCQKMQVLMVLCSSVQMKSPWRSRDSLKWQGRCKLCNNQL